MTATSVDAICQALAHLAPLELAEPWDNVGLLLGDRTLEIQNVMTCLTVTPSVVDEAIERQVGVIVSHHPLPFRPLSRINCDSITGQLLWRLIGARVAVYSAHTAFDSALQGINQAWADALGLVSIAPLVDPVSPNELGSGRYGDLPVGMSVQSVIRKCADFVSSLAVPRAVGPLDRLVTKVGFACGSGGTFVDQAARRGCELLVTGEASFHSCLEAEALGLSLGLLGHFQSERFAMQVLAQRLAEEFPSLTIWPSSSESDPIQTLDSQ